MRLLSALLLALPLPVLAESLAPVPSPELASVLGLSTELAATAPDSNQPYIVRIISAPTEIGECGGTVASCPDVRLFVTVSSGDLGEPPILYQLPSQKGWEFVAWTDPVVSGSESQASFVLRTTLPDANVERAARSAWRSVEYKVLVSTASASYVRD